MDAKNITLFLLKKILEIINNDFDYIGSNKSERI